MELKIFNPDFEGLWTEIWAKFRLQSWKFLNIFDKFLP